MSDERGETKHLSADDGVRPQPAPQTDLEKIAQWNAICDADDDPKPPVKGTPRSKWYWDTPGGRRARRRQRQGLAPASDEKVPEFPFVRQRGMFDD